MDKRETKTKDMAGTDPEEIYQKALDQAMVFLDYRPRTLQEMRQKLHDKGYGDEVIDQVVETLSQWRYLDDRNYAAEYVRFALAKSRGMRRIVQELARKGIDKEIVEQALYDYEDEEQKAVPEVELEKARDMAKKAARGKEWDKKLEARIGRRLASAGYNSDIVYRVLRELRQGEEDIFDDYS